MGSLAVLNMADHAALSAPSGERPVHPFFTAKRAALSDPPTETHKPLSDATSAQASISSLGDINDEGSRDEAMPEQEPRKRRKRTKGDGDLPVVGEKTIPKKRPKVAVGGNPASHLTPADGDKNPAGSLVAANTGRDNIGSNKVEQVETTIRPKPLSPSPPSSLNTSSASKPKKMMKFNPKTGTIGSPPKPKTSKIGPDAETSGKQSATGEANNGSSKLVKIQYGADDASRLRIGEKVNSILKGSLKTKTPRTPRKKPMHTAEPLPRIQKTPPKITHPFFAAKGKRHVPSNDATELPSGAIQASKPRRKTIQTSTPCSPKKSYIVQTNNNKAMMQFNTKSAGLKVPGSKLPAWPWKDMVHVRGDEDGSPPKQQIPTHSIPSRKSKGHAVRLALHDSLIDMVTRQMDIPALAEAVRNVNSDDFLPPPSELRLPTKHFESGSKLQKRILPELKCSSKLLADGKDLPSKKVSRRNGLVADDSGLAAHPPQLVRLFNLIQSSLSAFDRADCDNTCWTQKYSPVCAAEIIQPGQEAFYLKEWLQALVVQSVDKGAAPASGDSAGKEKDKKGNTGEARKKGRKRKKLDDFIVSSDEEADLMEEVSETEHDWTPSGKFGIVKKTVIRAGDLKARELGSSARLTNTILISGPHGCGKTAAVYAVAKELDFDVFEINSSSRRSGKDVDDKVGDMLKHHHVSQKKDAREKPAAKEGDAEAQISEDEVSQDTKSGRQKTMQAFFAKKTAPTKPTQAPCLASKAPAPKDAKKDAPKSQKQSLILLDEVDILYDEDKQFWTKVIELIVTSKRPFVMTCNDETLVPLHNLSLHGIFRLSHPPTDLAVDRLLLIAANEGHALRREAVEALYVASKYDLRAATAELNYWCQIGVGDRRGGFDWFYPRWPKGVDLDENKEVVRVVSENTYRLGMGWLGRDMVANQQMPTEEEILQQSWDLWSLDAGHWQDSLDFSGWADRVKDSTSEAGGRLAVLDRFDEFTEAMSAADICSSKSFADFKEELIDATKSDLCAGSCDDYVLGLPVLDAPPVIRYDRLSTVLPGTVKCMAKHYLGSTVAALWPQCRHQLPLLDENKATQMIYHRFKSSPPDTPAISRIDFSLAFDPIAVSDKAGSAPVSYLDPSVLDRNIEPIALDVAPYVRSIVAYDSNLQQQRLRLSNLISEGGRKGPKRMRTTRAAYSAMEGGSRSTTRAEKWFKAELNPHLVMKTGGTGWTGATLENGSSTARATPSPTKPTTPPSSSTAKESPSPIKAKAVPRKGRGRKQVVLKDDSDDELA